MPSYNTRALLISLSSALAYRKPIRNKTKVAGALLLFVVSFLMMALQAVDLAPLAHTSKWPAYSMTTEFEARALSIMNGHGLLLPNDQDPSDMRLLAHAPGYSVFLSIIYSLFGKNYFVVQLLQNTINSTSTVLLFLIVGQVISWRVGFISGLIAAISHHLSYFSNLIQPEPLCSFTVVVAFYLILKARQRPQNALALYALAGVVIGLSCWLRADAMALGPFIVAMLWIVSSRRWDVLKRASVMVLTSAIVISPIIIRNYLIYRHFVPINICFGIVLWEGIGESGGRRFGAVALDEEVIAQEVIIYNNESYGTHWAFPDGIKRNNDRLKKSLAVITAHPFWYIGTVLRRIWKMFSYTAYAETISKDGLRYSSVQEEIAEPKPQNTKVASYYIAFGENTSWLRLFALVLQRTVMWSSELFIFIGAVIAFVLFRRKFLFLMMVPSYYLLSHSLMHWEFRYTLPMHYFLFVFAALTWILLGAGLWNGVLRAAAIMKVKVLSP